MPTPHLPSPLLLTLLLLAACGDVSVPQAPAAEICQALDLCSDERPSEPRFDLLEVLVPSPRLPPTIAPALSNNNVDIAWFADRLFVAFRTASHHHPRADARICVVSTADRASWTDEGCFDLPDDQREPQLVVAGSELLLYISRVAASPVNFQPRGVVFAVRQSEGRWSTPAPLLEPDLLVWRIKPLNGALHLLGYTGVGGVLDTAGADVLWLRSADGRDWAPATAQAAVLHGGVSETDLDLLADGSLVAVSRNDGGDETGFGSKICTAPAGDRGSWQCRHDPRKFDSPLVFRHGERVYLIGRRHMTATGNFDLGYHWLPRLVQQGIYEASYWTKPKRCSLWEVLPATREVRLVLDLPSRGDTCFAEMLPLDPHHYLLFNYTSPLDGGDPSWREGQNGPTQIYYGVLSLP
jgi:hypothetical protein